MREKIIRHKKVYTRFNSSEYNDFLFPLRPVSCVSNVATCLWIGHSCTLCCHMSLDWPFLITPSVFSNVYSHALRECALCLLQASMSVTDATRAVK